MLVVPIQLSHIVLSFCALFALAAVVVCSGVRPAFSQTALDPTLIDRGGVVTLPSGTFRVSRTMRPDPAKGLILRGNGTKPTHLVLDTDLAGEPLLDCSGTIVPVLDDAGLPVVSPSGKPLNRLVPFANIEISNITIETDATLRPRDANGLEQRRFADAMRFQYVVEGKLDNVKVLGFDGHALWADCLWDTAFVGFQAARCGKAPWIDDAGEHAGKSAIHFADGRLVDDVLMSDGKPLWCTCNNNHFLACRFENGPYTLTYIGVNNSKNQFGFSKWHGELSKPTHSNSSPFDHVVIAGYGNTIAHSNLVRSGATAIRILEKAHGTIVEGCTIQSCDGYGIWMSNKARLRGRERGVPDQTADEKAKQLRDANRFADWELPNKAGNVKVE